MGCLLGGWIAEKVGRIKVIALGSIWGVFGASLQCSAQNSDWMICGMAASLKLNEGSHLANAISIARLINGIGTGMLNVIVPVWVCRFSLNYSMNRAIKTNITMLVYRNGTTYFARYIRFSRVLPEYLRCRCRLLAWLVSHDVT